MKRLIVQCALLLFASVVMGEGYGELELKLMYKGKPRKNVELEILLYPKSAEASGANLQCNYKSDKDGRLIIPLIKAGKCAIHVSITTGRGIQPCSGLYADLEDLLIEEGKTTKVILNLQMNEWDDCSHQPYFSIINGMEYRFSETWIQETAIGGR